MTSEHFLLLQINDALFPIGGYAHSYGLETYVFRGVVHDGPSAARYLRRYLEESFLYCDLLAARLAHGLARRGDLEGILRLEETLRAALNPAELRQASQKLGTRFVKTLSTMETPRPGGIFTRYSGESHPPLHPVAYGVICGDRGLDPALSLSHLLYAKASATVTCCVKAVPLSQTEGQRLLRTACERFPALLDRLMALTEDDLARAAPGFDIRSMEHEAMYSRLYMS